MSILACIVKLRGEGTIDAGRAEAFEKAFADLKSSYAKQFGEAVADAKASTDLIAGLEATMVQEQRQKLLQLKTQKGMLQRLDAAAGNKENLRRVAMAYFTAMEGVRGIRNIDLRHAAIAANARAMMNDFLGRMHRDLLGHVREPATMDNIVRELFGESTGDKSAAELAAAFTNTAEYLRGEFNLAGGAIGKLDRWGLPQGHDSLLVRKAGFDAWRDYIVPRLDMSRMIDNITGLPFTEARLGEVMREIYDHIATESLDRMVAGAMGDGKLANRRMDHRFLHFKNADAWLEYQGKFGTNAFDAINGHIDGMARDIAAMQVLGPNPAYTVRWLQDVLKQDAAMRGGDKDAINAAKASHAIQGMWQVFNGENNRPINPNISTAFATLRNLNAASKLGGAALSSLADLGLTHAMMNFNGLGSSRAVADYVRNLNPLREADRALARQTGILAQEYAQRAIDLHGNYNALAKMHEVSRRLNNGVMAVSGMHAVSTAGQATAAKGIMIGVASAAEKSFAELPRKVQAMLSRYGLDGDMWEAVRTTPAYVHSDGVFGEVNLIRPDEIAARKDLDPRMAQEATTRFNEMIVGEGRFATPDFGSSLRSRASLDFAAGRRGTVWGELLHSTTQFKQAPVAVVERIAQRLYYGDGSRMDRVMFGANAFIATTVLGGLIIQMKNIANGKDPEEMNHPAFWARGAMQGGAMGIYGDFLKDQLVLPGSSQRLARDTKTLGDLLIGPTVQSVADPILRLGFHETSLATTNELDNGDRPSNPGREAVQFLRENIPGSSLWYARKAFNAAVFDRLQMAIDPNAEGAFERQRQRAEQQQHTQYWWAPGAATPERAPQP